MQEKRQHPRKPVDVPVVITVEGTQETYTGRCRDMSIGGVFVVTEVRPPFGTKAKLTLQQPGEPIVLGGIVRWTAPDGFGLQFGALGARETHAIVQLVSVKR